MFALGVFLVVCGFMVLYFGFFYPPKNENIAIFRLRGKDAPHDLQAFNDLVVFFKGDTKRIDTLIKDEMIKAKSNNRAEATRRVRNKWING